MTFTNDQWQEAIVALANAGGSGGGPVTAVSGAFVAGAIVDLATLLTEFAELLTDTDNLATLVTNTNKIPASPAQEGGNLATIATNTSGLATDAHASSIVTNTANIPAKGSAAMSGSTPVTIATNDTVLSELLADTDNLATINAFLNTLAGAISSGKMQDNLAQVAGNAIAPGSNAVPILNSASTGYVSAYPSNPTALTSNTDAAFKWGAGGTTQVNHIMVQNNSSNNIQWDLDVATNAGSPVLGNVAPGNTLFLDVQTTAFHLQSIGTPNLNGSSANNVVIRGWL